MKIVLTGLQHHREHCVCFHAVGRVQPYSTAGAVAFYCAVTGSIDFTVR